MQSRGVHMEHLPASHTKPKLSRTAHNVSRCTCTVVSANVGCCLCLLQKIPIVIFNNHKPPRKINSNTCLKVTVTHSTCHFPKNSHMLWKLFKFVWDGISSSSKKAKLQWKHIYRIQVLVEIQENHCDIRLETEEICGCISKYPEMRQKGLSEAVGKLLK